MECGEGQPVHDHALSSVQPEDTSKMLTSVPRDCSRDLEILDGAQGDHYGCLGQSKNKLIVSAAIVFVFIIAQFLGGFFANSLAIMADTASLFLEFTSFLVGILAVLVATRLPSRRLTFGWYRTEVLAAVVSVILIWLLTALLLYEAIQRVLHTDYDIDADIMLITASFGLLVNVLLCAVLHTKNGDSALKSSETRRSPTVTSGPHVTPKCHNTDDCRRDKTSLGGAIRNINVQVAMMFVINDLVQSIGVIISAYIIKFKPEWKLADPMCTFLFSTMVLISSSKIVYDAVLVMMEAAPHHLNYDKIMNGLKTIQGVRGVHSLNIWSLTLSQTAATAHLITEPNVSHHQVLSEASFYLKKEHLINHTTIQLEEHDVTMEYCDKCKNRTV